MRRGVRPRILERTVVSFSKLKASLHCYKPPSKRVFVPTYASPPEHGCILDVSRLDQRGRHGTETPKCIRHRGTPNPTRVALPGRIRSTKRRGDKAVDPRRHMLLSRPGIDRRGGSIVCHKRIVSRRPSTLRSTSSCSRCVMMPIISDKYSPRTRRLCSTITSRVLCSACSTLIICAVRRKRNRRRTDT